MSHLARATSLALLAWAVAPTTNPAAEYREAEDHDPGAIAPLVIVADDPLASGGRYLMYQGTAVIDSFDDSTAGQAAYTTQVEAPGTLSVYVRRLFADNGRDSMWVKADGLTPWTRFAMVDNRRWGWVRVLQVPVAQAGSVTFRIGRREREARIDALYFTLGDERPAECKGLTPAITLEAESFLQGGDRGPWAIVDDPGAGGGRAVTWASSGQQVTPPPGEQLRYGFGLLEAAEVDVWARAKLPTAADNAIRVSVAGGEYRLVEGEPAPGWNWVPLGRFAARPGINVVALARAEDGISIDQIRVAIDGSLPYARSVLLPAEAFLPASPLAPLAVVRRVDALGGGGVGWPGSGAIDTTPSDADAGQLLHDLAVPRRGRWRIAVRAFQPGQGDALFHWRLGSGAWRSATEPSGGWSWRILHDDVLDPGTHRLRLLKGEDGVVFDAIHLADDGSPLPEPAALPAFGSSDRFVAPPPVGSDDGDGSAAAPWATLARAAARLQPGQTAWFREGVYPIAATVVPARPGRADAWITYRTFPGETGTIDGSVNYGIVNADIIDLTPLGSSFTRFDSLTFRNGGRGINLGQDAEFVRGRMVNMYHSGLWVSSRSKVLDSTFIDLNAMSRLTGAEGANEGIDCGGDDILIAGNEIAYGGKEGIDVIFGCTNTRVIGNHVHHMDEHWNDGLSGYPWAAGIYVDAANDERGIEVIGNVVSHSRAGITLNAEEYSGVADDLTDVTVAGNLVHEVQGPGISVSNNGAAGGLTSSILVLGNTVVGNRVASLGWSTLNEGVSIGNHTRDVVVRNNLLVGLPRPLRIEAAVAATTIADYNGIGFPAAATFVDAARGDFRLAKGSPAIDAGNPDPFYNDPDGSRADLGAFPTSGVPRPARLDLRHLASWVDSPALVPGSTVPSAGQGTDFGDQNHPHGAKRRRFLARNAGGLPLRIDAIVTLGEHPAEFAVDSSGPVILAPRESLAFTIAFDPTTTGPRRAVLEVRSDDAALPTFRAALGGNGIVAAPGLELSNRARVLHPSAEAPATLAFPPTRTDSQSLVPLRTLNAGGELLAVSASLVGPHAADFRLAPGPASSLGGGESTAWAIRFAPSSGGVRLATLRLQGNDPATPELEIPLAGLGVGGTYQQQGSGDRLVVLEAEGASALVDGSLGSFGRAWQAMADTTAAGGVFLVDPGDSFGSLPFEGSPVATYDIALVHAGALSIWVRSAATETGGADDSIAVSWNGVAVSTNAATHTGTTWGWRKLAFTISPGSTGTHRLGIHVREDGTRLDRIVLSTNPNYAPQNVASGLGPTASARLPLPPAFDAWLAARGLAPGSPEAAQGADPDRDGIANLLAFATGAPAGGPRRDPWIHVERLQDGTLLARHRRPPGGAPGVALVVQDSPTASGPWADTSFAPGTGNTRHVLEGDPDGDGSTEWIELRLAPGAGPNRLLRLRAQ